MNELIKKQLDSVTGINLPYYDEDTKSLFIPRANPADMNLVAGQYYIIELEDYILNPPSNFTLHQNWNNNIKPTCKYYKCEVLQVMGKMIKICGSGYDPNINKDLPLSWEGWLPQKGIKIIQHL